MTLNPNTNLFRMLNGKEEEAVTILDNRNVFSGENPNNNTLILCEHATNDLKSVKPGPGEDAFIRSSEAFDPFASDLTS